MTDALIHRLRSYSEAYPLDMFPELTKEEREMLHREHPGLLDRISASMGRHCGKIMDQGADAIERIPVQQTDYRTLLEIVVKEICEGGGLSEETCQQLDVALGHHIEMERPSRLEAEFAKVADDPIAKAMLKLGEGPHCPTCECGAPTMHEELES